MTKASTRKGKSLAMQSAQLAVAVPQVVAHRVTRMAIAGPKLSQRDRKEFALMVAEKESAFAEAWQAMAVQTVRANQALATTLLRSFWSPASWGQPLAGKLAAQMQGASLGILGKGMAPIHRKATANARRLAGTKLR